MGKGSFPFGRAGKALLPLKPHYTPEDIAAHLGEYLDALNDPQYLSLNRFVETFARWEPKSLTDDYGVVRE